MSHPISPRVNWFDGQNVTEEDLDTEQNAWINTSSNSTEIFAGSGVEQDFAIQRVLFDSDSAPASIQTLIDTQNFDGEPIFPIDSFGNTVILQPSDASQGNQLDIRISDSSLEGFASLKVFVFGTTFGGNFAQEAFIFNDNGTKISRNHYTSITAIMTQDFRGNQNTIVDGYASRNNGGSLKILEALPMRVARDTIMVEQSIEPNQDYKNFKPAVLFKTLDIVLDEIAASINASKDDLNINLQSTTQRTLAPNQTGVIVGEKFQATTNNIQKVTVLLSVERRSLVPAGQEFDWTGDIVLGIRRLQTATTCPTDVIPGTPIEFDPEPSALAEVSFDKADLENIGVVLTDEPKEVDFIFTQSALANPSVEPSIIPGDYYILTIRRTGNVSVGTIVLEEAANTSTDPTVTDTKRMSVFSQNSWVDVTESDLWFKVHTNALRIVDGVAIDEGVQIRNPKVKQNAVTGVEEPYIEGGLSLIDVASNAENYVIVQKANTFSQPEPSPTTGNLVFTRVEDSPDVSVVSQSTLVSLLDSGNNTVVLGMATDNNPVGNPLITGSTEYPGLQRGNKFTIINPSSDILVNNLVGSILVPNSADPTKKYRIIKTEIFTDIYGDVNGDGVIDIDDVNRAQEIGNIVGGDGYSTSLNLGSVPSATQISGVITSQSVSIDEILRADVNGTGIVSIADVALIQQHIILGTSFSVGGSFSRAVLTVEDLTDPLNTSVDIPGTDSVFNAVPFSNVSFRIEFLPLWSEENLEITDLRRFIPKTFTSIDSSDITGSTKSGGQNSTFIPGDMLLGGDILSLDGTNYPIDLEVSSIVIDLPEGNTEGEIDVFSNFIRNTMTFSDGTTVDLSALADNQVRVVASIQSFTKDLDGYDFQDGYSTIDESVSVLYTQTSGILRLRAYNIKRVDTRPELSTKIVLTVYLKKAGFNNLDQTISDLSDFLVPI
jgi:hypothetical protein